MALFEPSRRKHIQAVTQEWASRCLIRDGSLLDPARDSLWSAESLARAHHNIVEAPLLDNRSFLEKLRDQLEGDAQLVLLGGEATVIHYLFAWRGAVGAATKRARVNEILSWAGASLPEQGEAWQALGEEGIGHPGQYFLYRPDAQLGFLLSFALRLKSEDEAERKAILDDPWRLREFADASAPDGALPGMRHILLHLLKPEQFERIASGEHKQAILTAYGSLIADGGPEEPEERLYAIRQELQTLLAVPAERLDFYEPPLAGTWGAGQDDDASLVDKLRLKRQIVLYGPPGTSKTHEAKELAAQVIRVHALKEWGAAEYFKKQGRIDTLLKEHIRRLQLHPGYSYEEFIRGLRLRDNELTYEDGYLLRLIDTINDEQIPEGEPPLPWVLILDELNRADLSRVLGEAFSVLEDRDSPVTLAGGDSGHPDREIKLPERLYLIGTMNLIDQSLEQIDFALRRRFLWQPSRFDSTRLTRVLREEWDKQPQSSHYPWDRISAEVETFVERAVRLNKQIEDSATLSSDYEIGHTYFFDLITLLAVADHVNRPRTQRFLWTRKGEALEPVDALWRMSLRPLLEQYLQGVDPATREAELAKFADAFLIGQA